MIFVFCYILSVMCLREQGSSPKPQSQRRGCFQQRSVFVKRWHLVTAQLWPATNTVKWFLLQGPQRLQWILLCEKSLKRAVTMWYLALILFGSIQKSLLGVSTAWPLPIQMAVETCRGAASVGLPGGGGLGPSNSEVPALCPWHYMDPGLLSSRTGCGQIWVQPTGNSLQGSHTTLPYTNIV